MKVKGRERSGNIEDKRPGKIKPWYDGLPLSNRFTKQEEYISPNPTVRRRGRKVSVSSKNKIYSREGGGYR